MIPKETSVNSSGLYSSEVTLHLAIQEHLIRLGAVNRFTATLHPQASLEVEINQFLESICELIISVDGDKRVQKILLERYRPEMRQFEFSLAA